MQKRKTVRLGGLGSLVTGLFLVVAAVAAMPVFAVNGGPQTGDVWTQPGGTPEETSGHSQEVHLPCGNVDVWSDDLDHLSGGFQVYSIPPSHVVSDKGVPAFSGSFTAAPTDAKSGEIPRSFFQGTFGPHYKVELTQDNNKYKTFWVTCGQKVTPDISTTTVPATAVIGTVLKDTAHLTNGDGPTGTITFSLYRPGESVAVHTETVDVTNDGDYTTPAGFAADKVGTWYWVAAYGGDDQNQAVSSGKTDEPVIVSRASPTITTNQTPTGGVPGVSMTDTATLSDGYGPTGTIVFKLYDPADALAYTSTAVTVHGNATYSNPAAQTASSIGTYHWVAEYSGDDNNNAVASGALAEPVAIRAPEKPNIVTPTITTTTNPSSGTVGTVLNDTAHLTAGSAPTGTITFTLYKPNGSVAYTQTVNVSGNADYSTPNGFASDVAGTWRWVAAYSGDTGNNPVATGYNDEQVTITSPSGAVLGETLARTGSDNWPLTLGILLVLLGTMALAASAVTARRWDS